MVIITLLVLAERTIDVGLSGLNMTYNVMTTPWCALVRQLTLSIKLTVNGEW